MTNASMIMNVVFEYLLKIFFFLYIPESRNAGSFFFFFRNVTLYFAFSLRCRWVISDVDIFSLLIGQMNHKLESRLLGEISTTSDMQMILI